MTQSDNIEPIIIYYDIHVAMTGFICADNKQFTFIKDTDYY